MKYLYNYIEGDFTSKIYSVKYIKNMILNESTPVGFVVLNNNCKVTNLTKPKRMQFYTTLGYGETNSDLDHLVKISLKLIKESGNLPVNYFI